MLLNKRFTKITNKKIVKNFVFGIDKQKMMLYDKNVSKKVNTKSPSLVPSKRQAQSAKVFRVPHTNF